MAMHASVKDYLLYSQYRIYWLWHCFLGGPLTVTDANLCLNRLLPDYFPKIFGRTQDQPLDKAATLKAFSKLTDEVSFAVCSSRVYCLLNTCLLSYFSLFKM